MALALDDGAFDAADFARCLLRGVGGGRAAASARVSSRAFHDVQTATDALTGFAARSEEYLNQRSDGSCKLPDVVGAYLNISPNAAELFSACWLAPVRPAATSAALKCLLSIARYATEVGTNSTIRTEAYMQDDGTSSISNAPARLDTGEARTVLRVRSVLKDAVKGRAPALVAVLEASGSSRNTEAANLVTRLLAKVVVQHPLLAKECVNRIDLGSQAVRTCLTYARDGTFRQGVCQLVTALLASGDHDVVWSLASRRRESLILCMRAFIPDSERAAKNPVHPLSDQDGRCFNALLRLIHKCALDCPSVALSRQMVATPMLELVAAIVYSGPGKHSRGSVDLVVAAARDFFLATISRPDVVATRHLAALLAEVASVSSLPRLDLVLESLSLSPRAARSLLHTAPLVYAQPSLSSQWFAGAAIVAKCAAELRTPTTIFAKSRFFEKTWTHSSPLVRHFGVLAGLAYCEAFLAQASEHGSAKLHLPPLQLVETLMRDTESVSELAQRLYGSYRLLSAGEFDDYGLDGTRHVVDDLSTGASSGAVRILRACLYQAPAETLSALFSRQALAPMLYHASERRRDGATVEHVLSQTGLFGTGHSFEPRLWTEVASCLSSRDACTALAKMVADAWSKPHALFDDVQALSTNAGNNELPLALLSAAAIRRLKRLRTVRAADSVKGPESLQANNSPLAATLCGVLAAIYWVTPHDKARSLIRNALGDDVSGTWATVYDIARKQGTGCTLLDAVHLISRVQGNTDPSSTEAESCIAQLEAMLHADVGRDVRSCVAQGLRCLSPRKMLSKRRKQVSRLNGRILSLVVQAEVKNYCALERIIRTELVPHSEALQKFRSLLHEELNRPGVPAECAKQSHVAADCPRIDSLLLAIADLTAAGLSTSMRQLIQEQLGTKSIATFCERLLEWVSVLPAAAANGNESLSSHRKLRGLFQAYACTVSCDSSRARALTLLGIEKVLQFLSEDDVAAILTEIDVEALACLCRCSRGFSVFCLRKCLDPTWVRAIELRKLVCILQSALLGRFHDDDVDLGRVAQAVVAVFAVEPANPHIARALEVWTTAERADCRYVLSELLRHHPQPTEAASSILVEVTRQVNAGISMRENMWCALDAALGLLRDDCMGTVEYGIMSGALLALCSQAHVDHTRRLRAIVALLETAESRSIFANARVMELERVEKAVRTVVAEEAGGLDKHDCFLELAFWTLRMDLLDTSATRGVLARLAGRCGGLKEQTQALKRRQIQQVSDAAHLCAKKFSREIVTDADADAFSRIEGFLSAQNVYYGSSDPCDSAVRQAMTEIARLLAACRGRCFSSYVERRAHLFETDTSGKTLKYFDTDILWRTSDTLLSGGAYRNCEDLYDPVSTLGMLRRACLSAGECMSQSVIDVGHIVRSGLLAVAISGTSCGDRDVRIAAYSALASLASALGPEEGVGRASAAALYRDRRQLAAMLQRLRDSVREPLQKTSSVFAAFFNSMVDVILKPTHECYKEMTKFFVRAPVMNVKEIDGVRFLLREPNRECQRLALRVLRCSLHSVADHSLARRYRLYDGMLCLSSELSLDVLDTLIGIVSQVPERVALDFVLSEGFLPWLTSLPSCPLTLRRGAELVEAFASAVAGTSNLPALELLSEALLNVSGRLDNDDKSITQAAYALSKLGCCSPQILNMWLLPEHQAGLGKEACLDPETIGEDLVFRALHTCVSPEGACSIEHTAPWRGGGLLRFVAESLMANPDLCSDRVRCALASLVMARSGPTSWALLACICGIHPELWTGDMEQLVRDLVGQFVLPGTPLDLAIEDAELPTPVSRKICRDIAQRLVVRTTNNANVCYDGETLSKCVDRKRV